MHPQALSRRLFLKSAAFAVSAAALAGCAPKVVEKIVQQTVVVTQEKVVKETVQVRSRGKGVEK